MQSTVTVLATLVAVASAQLYNLPDDLKCLMDPTLCEQGGRFYYRSHMANRPGTITWNKPAGNGKVFGTLGSTDQGLFGQTGYKQTLFNDDRGKLEGQAHGTRILGPNGDSSHFGGKLEWSNRDANAALDVNKQIGGPTSVSAGGSGKWNLDKNTEVSAGGSVSHTGHGKPDVAVEAKIEHKF